MNTTELFEHAQEKLLKNGEQSAPIMFVEYTDHTGEECISLFYFAAFGMDTPLAEKMQMFALGYQFGESREEDIQITQLAFIAEAWTATVQKGETRTWKRPHEALNRREALMMQLVEIQPTPDGKGEMKQSIKEAEIIRYGSIVDLGNITEDITEDITIMNLTLPAYFLAGYNGSHLSGEELQDMLRKMEDGL